MTAPRLVAVLGPTATGKSAIGLGLAARLDGEIVACDSTAVYRGFDIGTDKVPPSEQRGIPHHMVDVVEPTETYSAARWARDAAAAIRAISSRGRVPILVGGTGFYYRALTRGIFDGPARDDRLRARLSRIASRRGAASLHRWLRRVDDDAAARIAPADVKRVVRALEVWLLTGRPLTAHFAETHPALAEYNVTAFALHVPPAETVRRVARRVEAQFDRGVVREVETLLASGVPETAHPFTGLVYRQVLELLHGVRDEAATRALIVQENRRYSRRQLIWFRKEPNLRWIHAVGEHAETIETVLRTLAASEPVVDADSEGP